MSYCRFSSMNWMCDVYVYEDCSGGWTTHVASNRRIIPPIPEIPLGWPFRKASVGAYFDKETRKVIYPNKINATKARINTRLWRFTHRINMWSLGKIPSKSIGLPYDGDNFNDDTPRECAERLINLRKIGYKVPQYAIDSLLEEQAEMDAANG